MTTFAPELGLSMPATGNECMTLNRRVVFGAPDAERNEAVEVARAGGATVSLATKHGREVHPGNAYDADPIDVGPDEEVIFFECDVPGLTPARRLDHHRDGDNGFDVPAEGEGYLRGSPLGQLATIVGVELTPWQKAAAADDHHLRKAFRGLCEGVTTELARARRYQDIADKKGLDVEEVEKTVASYQETVRSAPRITIGESEVVDLRSVYLGYTNSLEYLSLQTAVIEADKAGILCTQDEENEPVKITLTSDSPELTRTYKEEWAPANGLVGIYGCEVREYAGGYHRGSHEVATAARHLLGLVAKPEHSQST